MSKIEVKINERSLIINGLNVEFEQRIVDVVTLADRVIVALDMMGFAENDFNAGRNVVALDVNGEMLWRIEDPKILRHTMNKRKISWGFMDVDLGDDGIVTVLNEMLWLYDVDPATGRLLNKRFATHDRPSTNS